ncbi:hypothetical protein VNO77_05822 [Canavalia gladiata]|uniref:Glycosyltransferase n=1 Tax=Canavalia gladiata TaxID=3824 RepID=A0AAN9MZS7_CANGL
MDFQQRSLKLHFIPYLAAGHFIPLCDLATLFVSRGQHVTVITTPSNAQILRKSNPSLHLHIVDFPSKEVGLDDGVQTMTNLDNLTNSAKFYRAAMLLRGPIELFVEQHRPDYIVADFLYPWVDDMANNLGIPRLAFNGFSLFTVSAMESVKAHSTTLHSETGPFDIPDFPHHITMCSRPPKMFTKFMEPLLGLELKSYGLIVNNFEELDGEEYVHHYEKITGHKAWHIGPACMVRRMAQEKAVRGEKSVVSEQECLSWLNSKPASSVVYICFGSVCRFPDKQLFEMACGMEQGGYNFIWVVPEKKGKEDESEEEKEKWLPKGFEERNKDQVMIIRGWAPQLLILSHSSVGAFLTHCGWNSTLEGTSAGVPMITWPVQGDQFYNERLITQVRGIGVQVGATEWSIIGFGERQKLVDRDSIHNAITRLMDGADEAVQIRRRARRFGEKAKKALQHGGSSHNNLTALIEDLMRFKDSKPLQ